MDPVESDHIDSDHIDSDRLEPDRLEPDRLEPDRLVRLIVETGATLGLHEKDILGRAGLGKTTLSKIKRARDTKVSTLSRMANVVGLRLTLAPNNPTLDQLLNRALFSKPPTARP